MKNKTVYKVGDILVAKQSKQIVEIVSEKVYHGDLQTYVVKKFNTINCGFEYYDSEMTDKFIKCPVAQLLYSKR